MFGTGGGGVDTAGVAGQAGPDLDGGEGQSDRGKEVEEARLRRLMQENAALRAELEANKKAKAEAAAVAGAMGG
jgi:hypothetical protein